MEYAFNRREAEEINALRNEKQEGLYRALLVQAERAIK